MSNGSFTSITIECISLSNSTRVDIERRFLDEEFHRTTARSPLTLNDDDDDDDDDDALHIEVFSLLLVDNELPIEMKFEETCRCHREHLEQCPSKILDVHVQWEQTTVCRIKERSACCYR
jgi:hypothetical protein